MFAAYINEKYGYPVFQINDSEGKLVHCFGIVKDEGKYYFVDVRGVTTDYSEFIEEFEDWIDEEESIDNTSPLDVSKIKIPKEYREFLDNLFYDCGCYYSGLEYFATQEEEKEC